MVSACNADSLPAGLRGFFANNPRLVVAYSGGLDSRFLCHAALLCGCEIMALHARGPHMAPGETAAAIAWAGKRKIPLLEFDANPLELDEVAANTRQRCHACKKNMFLALFQALEKNGEPRRIICDGGNSDDLKKYRPGQAAAAELGIHSPLALAGLGKDEIRKLAAMTGMDNPEQKARPCLLTRFAYGLAPDIAMLRKLGRAENALEKYFASRQGPQADFRLRITPRAVLQVDAQGPLDEAVISLILAEHGFENCEILRESGISGFFDRTRQAARLAQSGL